MGSDGAPVYVLFSVAIDERKECKLGTDSIPRGRELSLAFDAKLLPQMLPRLLFPQAAVAFP